MASFETLDFQVIRSFVQAPHTVDMLLAFASGSVSAIVFQEIANQGGIVVSWYSNSQMGIQYYAYCRCLT